jgi:hypothetical protein
MDFQKQDRLTRNENNLKFSKNENGYGAFALLLIQGRLQSASYELNKEGSATSSDQRGIKIPYCGYEPTSH